MILLVHFIAAVFACYRLARLFVVDDGPGDVFLRLRRRVGVYDLGPDDRPRTTLGRIFECPHCLGMYLALPLALWAVGLSLDVIIAWLAIAGAQSILQSWVGKVEA